MRVICEFAIFRHFLWHSLVFNKKRQGAPFLLCSDTFEIYFEWREIWHLNERLFVHRRWAYIVHIELTSCWQDVISHESVHRDYLISTPHWGIWSFLDISSEFSIRLEFSMVSQNSRHLWKLISSFRRNSHALRFVCVYVGVFDQHTMRHGIDTYIYTQHAISL